ncbi:MAG: hypothetical protein Sv326_1307 [Candidatus Fermentimicrarchaeum limneticum]|uniref:Antitoxin n=1 Tax=Fermentimicrarchaeum limneticum TaxID=2795018 RepID=A0A7D6BPH9_FERL1|nr:MAG: hypothetical protein Sv326_1307 [Candidatus Fermentimicrarchaeum limneticum]
MVQAVIDISEHANRVLAVVKAKHGLNDKSQAIELMAMEYEEKVLEPALRPEYAEKLKKIRKGKFIRVKNFKEHFGL